MSCQKCNDAQDGNFEESENPTIFRLKDNGVAYYRWKNANIEMNGCDEHLREVFDALNKIQQDAQNK